jgi:coatomer protein complex subunit gamma
MVQAIERFIKQAIVDKDSSVSSAALVSAIHLYNQGSKEVVKRWVNEVQEAINRPSGLIQYHALGLMYHIKQVHCFFTHKSFIFNTQNR